ncbi:MAG TPA: SxtJ family membrane protein [Candidatus Binatia bacterium]|nr:SxtJ family membrane protein [Candidatus Binatia bacterium]
MQSDTDAKQLRSFGLMVGAIFAGIGLWPVAIHAAAPRWWAMIASVCLIIPALASPNRLAWVYQRWMALGHILGSINSRILLGLVFYLVVTPIGVIRRLLGKDPMGTQLRADLDSYRTIRKPRPASHLRRQY